MSLVGLLLIPLVVCGAAFIFFKHEITWKEFLLQIGICCPILIISWFIVKYESLSSPQYLNGYITQKIVEDRKCCHCWTVCDVYQDVCSSTDSKGSCTSYSKQCTVSHEECSHSYGYDKSFELDSTVGTFTIDSCNHSVPYEWEKAYIGEPASVESSYDNYLKADANSLFVHTEIKKFEPIPDYPALHDRYSVDHVVSSGPAIPRSWPFELGKINGDLGPKNQLDLTILLTYNKDPNYAKAVEAKWLYGPKNSFNIILGLDKDNNVKWARGISISKVNALKIKVRDTLANKNINDKDFLPTIKELVSSFKRTPMVEFEYLIRNAEPSDGWLIFLYILALLGSVGTSVWMSKEDVFGEESFVRKYYGR